VAKHFEQEYELSIRIKNGYYLKIPATVNYTIRTKSAQWDKI